MTKELINTILQEYPWMDHLMAESLVKASERGVLQEMAESWKKEKNNIECKESNGERTD